MNSWQWATTLSELMGGAKGCPVLEASAAVRTGHGGTLRTYTLKAQLLRRSTALADTTMHSKVVRPHTGGGRACAAGSAAAGAAAAGAAGAAAGRVMPAGRAPSPLCACTRKVVPPARPRTRPRGVSALHVSACGCLTGPQRAPLRGCPASAWPGHRGAHTRPQRPVHVTCGGCEAQRHILCARTRWCAARRASDVLPAGI